MAEAIYKYLKVDYVFWTLLLVSIGLIIAGFCAPPLAIIDGSVLIAVGELISFGALNEVGKAIAYGRKVSFNHGNTSISVNTTDNPDILDQDQINDEVEDVE